MNKLLISSLHIAVEETEDLAGEFVKLSDFARLNKDAETQREIHALTDRTLIACAKIMTHARFLDLSTSTTPHVSDDSEVGDDAE